MKINEYIKMNSEEGELFFETEILVPESAGMVIEVRGINQKAPANSPKPEQLRA